MKKQRTFTAAFKARVALDAIKGIKNTEKISGEYEIHPTQIQKWKAQAIQLLPMIFEKNDHDQVEKIRLEHEAEITKLYETIGRLTTDNNRLKKISGELLNN